MKVCIAEKPSVAKEIAYVLGAKARKDGYYEGNGYQVTWTFGHLCTLKTPDDYRDEWAKWRLDQLPMLPEKFEIKLMKDKGVKKQFGVIKKLFRRAAVVINCGDAGQEGELIQRWVMQQAGYKGKVQRLWISSLTTEAIREGFRNLRDAAHYDDLYYAGFSRAGGDWLLGMNATRLYTLRYGGYKQVLSVGRVQTPTLAMLVQRQREIDNFKPEPYWELHTRYREVDFACIKGQFNKKEDGEQLLAQVTDHPFTITKVEKRNGKEYAPPLFDLTSLQVHCNKRFGLSADQTLKIAQKLYEQKLLTYPRTDTTYLPNDQYPKLPGILGKMSNYATLTAPLLGTKLRKSSRVFNDKKVTDHHAIIPTGAQRKLMGAEFNVYDAVARRFIAVFYPDCEVAKTTVLGESNEVVFRTSGKVILKPGWRVVLPSPKAKLKDSKKQADKNADRELPPFKTGENGPHEPKLLEKMTQPPKYYTEASLLRAMETAGKKTDDRELRDLMKANGIGRPSTRAAIIETLFRRKYIRRVKKQLHATETGCSLIDVIQNDLLKSVELTGQWEKHLRDIAAGEYNPKTFIDDMKKLVEEVVTEVRKDNRSLKIAAPTTGGYGRGKSGRKTGRSAEKFGARVKTKADKERAAKRSAKAAPVGKVPLTELECPRCRRAKLLRGRTAYGCARYAEGCSFRLPLEYLGKKISDNQLRRLLAKGSTVDLKGFDGPNGKHTGKIVLTSSFELRFVPKGGGSKNSATGKSGFKSRPSSNPSTAPVDSGTTRRATLPCPGCQSGEVMRGRTAYGCTRHAQGCGWTYSYAELRQKVNGRAMTKELVARILRGEV